MRSFLGGVGLYCLSFSSRSIARNQPGAVMCVFWVEICFSSSFMEKVLKSTSSIVSALRH